MNNILLALIAFMVSTSAMASTEHYIRKDGNHVQQLLLWRCHSTSTETTIQALLGQMKPIC